MKLQFITTEFCPTCGAPPYKEQIKFETDGMGNPRIPFKFLTHINGGRWETRTFVCGFAVEYIPNFSREEVYTKCGQDPEVLALKANRKNIAAEVKKLLGNYNDPRFSAEVIERMEHFIKWG